MKKILQFIMLVFLAAGVSGQYRLSPKDLIVLEDAPGQMMRDHMISIAERQFAQRDSLLATLRTAEDWDRRAGVIRDSMVSWTGPFPEPTPLNARITGRLVREGYTVEKILFESRPGYLVSANLYLPENVTFPRPAVLNVIGHYGGGKSTGLVQERCIGQARKGFVALSIDALGQGERRVSDYAPVGGGGRTHKTVGKQAFICGTHLFNLMVWDAIRAIDYLESRTEVDKDNICVTGCSGGGMMSTLILPLEERIKVSVPACYPNSHAPEYRGWVGTDSEKIFFGAFRSLIDPRGDPLFCHVPRPLQINATTGDGNSPMGVWELSTWLYKSYTAHGVPERLNISMVSGPHGYNREQREAAYAWMMRWTDTFQGNFQEGDIETETSRDLQAAPGGNVFDEPESRKPREILLEYLNEHKASWDPEASEVAAGTHRTRMVRSIKSVLRMDPAHFSADYELKEPRTSGNVTIRPFLLKPEKGIVLPGVLLESVERAAEKGVILYINVRSTIADSYSKGVVPCSMESGKSNLLKQQDVVREILEEGYALCAVDLRGTGETGPFNEEDNWHFMCGELIFGQRLRDVLATVHWLRNQVDGSTGIRLWGSGMGSLYGAFAGVLDEDISSFILEEPLISFESLVEVTIPQYGTEIIIPGILEHFDMTNIYQALCPRPVTLINPLLGDKSRAATSDMEQINGPVMKTYRETGNLKAWEIQSTDHQTGIQILKK